MFQRKSDLPARPPFPTNEEILEDLSLANFDDVVFKHESEFFNSSNNTRNYIDSKNSVSEVLGDNYSIKTLNQHIDPNEALYKISSFVDKMNILEERLIFLRKEKDGLSALGKSLTADMVKIQTELKKQKELKQM